MMTWVQAAALAAAFTASPEASDCRPDSDGFCTGQIVHHSLRYAVGADTIVRVNAAIGTALTVELPPYVGLREGGTIPVGNESILDSSKPVGSSQSPTNPVRVTFWPRDSEKFDAVGLRTNVNLMLDGGVSVIIQVKITSEDDERNSVQRLIFDFPERANESVYVKERMAAERSALLQEVADMKQTLQNDFSVESRKSTARGMLQFSNCESLRIREESDLLVVRAKQICRIGSQVFIKFAVENHARDLFTLDEIVVKPATTGGADIKPDVTFESPDKPILGYDDVSRGVASFAVDKIDKSYTFTVKEAAGKKRIVSIKNVSF